MVYFLPEMDEATANGMDPREVAELIVRGIEKRQKELVICEFTAKIGILMRALSPSLYFYIMAKRARRLEPLERA